MATVASTSKTDDIRNILSGGKDTGKAAQDARSLSADFDNFLLLLTTQLKNQDPTQPFDTNQFTQQLAALSTVEQQINTNKNMEKLVATFNATQFSNSVNYIGKTIDTEGDKGVLNKDGALFVYSLESAADAVKVSVTDSTGAVVFSGKGTGKAGRNEVVWDGVNSFNSKDMPDGTYTITVKATAGGRDVKASTITTGKVTSVEQKDGGFTLMLGDIAVKPDKVIAVRDLI